MATKKKVRSIIALIIIVLVGLTGAGFFGLRLLRRAPREFRALARANRLLEAGQYEEACAKAEECLGHDELDFHGRKLIARARGRLKQFDAAQAIVQAGLTAERRKQYDQALATLQEELAKLDQGQDRSAKQTELEKGFRESHPGYMEFLELELSSVGVRLSHAQSIIASQPDQLTLTAEVKNRTGVRRQVEDEMNASARTLDRLVRNHPENARVYEMLGDLYLSRRGFIRAAASAYVQEGRQFRLLDKHVQAASTRRRGRQALAELPTLRMRATWAFKNACRCNPDSAQSRISLANLLRSGANPNYGQALAELEEVLKRSDRISGRYVVVARMIRADLMRRTGKLDEAVIDMKALLSEQPKDGLVVLNYIELLLEQADQTDVPENRLDCLKEARQLIEQTEKQTNSPQLTFLKSRMLLAYNEPTEAAGSLSQVMDNLPPMDYGLQFVAHVGYYLGKARLYYVEQARLNIEAAEKALKQAQNTGIREKIGQAVENKHTAEENYRKLALAAQAGLDNLNEAANRIRMVRQFLPPDERKRVDAMLVDAQTIIVHTMLARGELGDAPERMLKALAVDLDNNLVYKLLTAAIKRETDTDKSHKLTVAAVNFRLLSGRYEETRKEADAALSIFGLTEQEARKELADAKTTRKPELVRKVLNKIRGTEQLEAIAGLACLLQNDRPAGMAHFKQAALLRNLRRPTTSTTPEIAPETYAQQQYALLTMIQFRRRMHTEADRTLAQALKQFPDGLSLLVTQAGMARERKRLGTAIETYKRAIRLNPKRGELHTVLARLYLTMGMPSDAIKQVSLISPDTPRSYRLLIELAQIYSRLRQHDQLRKVLTELLTTYGNNPRGGLRTRLVAASFYMDCNEYETASKLADIPSNIQAPSGLHVERANIFIATGQFAKAVEALELVMKASPDAPSFYTLGLVYLQLDQVRLDNGDQPKRRVMQAVELARKICSDYPEFGHARLLEAGALFHADKTDQALELLDDPFDVGKGATLNNRLRLELQTLFMIDRNQIDKALKKLPQPNVSSSKVAKQLISATNDMLVRVSKLPTEDRKQALKALVRTHLARRSPNWQLATANGRELVTILPEDPILTLGLAADYGRSGQTDKARSILMAYLKVNPDFAKAWHLLGQLCRRANEAIAAENAFKKYLQLIDDSPSVEVELANILEGLGKRAEAVKLYESVISKSDRFPVVFNNLAYHLITAEKPDPGRAMQYAERAVALAPFNGDYRDTLGWILYTGKQFEKALEELEKAVGLDPSNPIIRYHLGMIYLKQTSIPKNEREKKATDALHEALAISPNFLYADLAVRELKKLSGN